MSLTVKTEYLKRGGRLIAYLHFAKKVYAYGVLDGVKYSDKGNQREPYDFRLCILDLPEEAHSRAGGFSVWVKPRTADTETAETEYISFDETAIVPETTAIFRTDRGLELCETDKKEISPGVCRLLRFYKTAEGLPVRVYTLICDPKYVDFLAGIPHGENIQTVMEEAEWVKSSGKTVVGAVNGDFFDMFGDCHPSGLCVSEGKTVANKDSDMPFFGVTREGAPVIATADSIPAEMLFEAVSGRQLIVKNGATFDTAPLEPFGDVAHPRTAVGITADGMVVLTVVDGRRPDWSNGATLTDLSKIMLSDGAVTALNLDGGGSSTFITENGGLEMLNHPADLDRPDEDIVRPMFNSVIVVRK